MLPTIPIKLLAIDTATQVCTVALMLGDNIYQLSNNIPQQHGQFILPMINELLADHQLSLQELDALAFSHGPGSFTGIRMAAGVVQGLALSTHLPIIGISTLQTLAQTAWRQYQANKVLTCIDARMHEIYWGAYQLDEHQLMQALTTDIMCPPTTIIAPQGTGWWGVGDGWKTYPELKTTCESVLQQIEPDCFPQAQDLAILARNNFIQRKSVTPENAQPVYLRGAESWKKITTIPR